MVAAVNNDIVPGQMESVSIPAGCSSWEDLKSQTAGEEELMDEVQSKDALPEGSPSKDSLTKKKGDEVIIRAFAFTGRTHQIRLHSQYTGMPLEVMRNTVDLTSETECNTTITPSMPMHNPSRRDPRP
ncbi:hypothetical protein Mapa_016249 [Marchantia paleacea]|nr:hypothetical protein Mapa_016249 [Marchantia paleacea]